MNVYQFLADIATSYNKSITSMSAVCTVIAADSDLTISDGFYFGQFSPPLPSVSDYIDGFFNSSNFFIVPNENYIFDTANCPFVTQFIGYKVTWQNI